MIVLELSDDEAQVVADIFMRIGGSPVDSRRGLVDRVRAALRREHVLGTVASEDLSGSIYFLTEEHTL